jgi:hypothetical protein
MSYYVRLLSHSDKIIPFNEIKAEVDSLHLLKGNDQNWEQLEVTGTEGGSIARIERHPTGENPGESELERLKNEVSRAYPENARNWLYDYLSRVKTIYSFQLSTDNIDSKQDWIILGRIQNYLKDNLTGIIQADNEGFFNENGDYILWQMYAGAGGSVPAATLDEKGEWIPFQLKLDDEQAVERFKRGEMPRRGLLDILFKR